MLLLLFSSSSLALNFEEARHFLHRTGFGASLTEIRALAGKSRKSAVEELLESVRTQPVTPFPSWYAMGYDKISLLSSDRKEQQKLRRQWGMEAKEWWAREIITTPSPFTEKMVLFWHNHFTSELRKVKWAQLMLRQNRLFRENATGSFQILLDKILKDPAMLIYLDVHGSKKARPNENFARELMELFTLGEGNYSEKDIQELARVFTGYRIKRQTAEVTFQKKQHDFGEKSILGQSGKFPLPEVAPLLLSQPSTAPFLVSKLWQEFIGTPLPETELKRLSQLLISSKWHVAPVIREILLHEEFWKEENRANQIKSPVDTILGFLRTLEYHPREMRPFITGLRRLGQDLFDPPSVKGFSRGNEWLTTSSLLQRHQMIGRFFRGMAVKPYVDRLFEQAEEHEIAELLLPPIASSRKLSATGETGLRRLMYEPEFELK